MSDFHSDALVFFGATVGGQQRSTRKSRRLEAGLTR
jgi:hypothetical protein